MRVQFTKVHRCIVECIMSFTHLKMFAIDNEHDKAAKIFIMELHFIL